MEKAQTVSVRLTAKEMRVFKAAADRTDKKFSDFLREAIASYAAARREPTIEVNAPPAFRMFSTRGEPWSIGTGRSQGKDHGGPAPTAGTATLYN